MGYTPPSNEALATTGASGALAGTATQSLVVALLAVIAGTTLLAVSRLMGRVAVEPIRFGTTDAGGSEHKLRMTFNGRPVGNTSFPGRGGRSGNRGLADQR
ncbi:hypothetical protein GCM10027061_17150 [Nesterenkonia suensis]